MKKVMAAEENFRRLGSLRNEMSTSLEDTGKSKNTTERFEGMYK